MPQQPTPQWQPMNQLALIASHIDGMLEAAQEQYETLQPARGHHADSCVEMRKRQASRRPWNNSLSKRKKLCTFGVLHTLGEACLLIGHEEPFGVATEIQLDHTPSF